MILHPVSCFGTKKHTLTPSSSAGYKVITTNSPKHNDNLASLGAVKSFNYADSDVGQQIKDYTSNKLAYAFDTIGQESSAKICAEALSTLSSTELASGEKRYATILQAKLPRDPNDVVFVGTMMYSMFGEEYTKGGRTTPPSMEDFEFQKKFMGLTEKLLAEGKLKTHEEDVRPGGLQGVLKGLEDLKNDRVSGKKLVYNVADTE